MPNRPEPAFDASRLPALRSFGRFALRELIGRSRHAMLWLADEANGALLLELPRHPPGDAAARAEWLADARRAARLSHPGLAAVIEVGEHEHWPFVAYEAVAGRPLPGVEPESHNALAAWLGQALEALAYAHEAGLWHGDLQPYHLWVDDRGTLRVVGMGVGCAGALAQPAAPVASRGLSMDPRRLLAQRVGGEQDVLTVGALAHALLAGATPFGEPDLRRVVERLPPLGRDVLRLPWATPQPVADALRVIVNRATAHQPRQRYLSARSLARALEGWRLADAAASGGPVALLQDRLAAVGHLPVGRDALVAIARWGGERQHVRAMARQALLDLALAFELLRQVNTAGVHALQARGSGPVLTARRAIALLGLDGVRACAASLRAWPGPLDGAAAAALREVIECARLAGYLAQQIRPAGYDAEAIFLIAVLQNAGRLMLHYHFADDAAQVRDLMRADPSGEPGLSEAAAVQAVLGIDLDAFGVALARWLGLGDEALGMLRRLPLDRPVRRAGGDADLLRGTASAANEIVDALALARAAPAGAAAALKEIAKRYAPLVELHPRSLDAAVQAARAACDDVGGTPEAPSFAATAT